jgi:hypothetical protein
MARIRSIKPDFFRHEALQDAEIANPGKYPMMVFAGLWGHCDSKGRFEWRPRQLKLDILPFLPFDMAETLEILAKSGMVNRYEVDGKSYGEIPTFEKHQRLSGKEVTEGEKHPEPNGEATGKQSGSNRDEQESQEGKGREGNRNGVNPAPDKPARFDPVAMPLPACLHPTDWSAWISYRRARKLTTAEPTMLKQLQFLTECNARGQPPAAIINASITNGWQGLFEQKAGGSNGKNGSSRADRISATIAELTGANRHPAAAIDGIATRVD